MSENTLPDDTSVHAYVGRICFKTGPPHRVGLELEWLIAPTTDPARQLPLDTLSDVIRAAEPLPSASRITMEPGGQLELSSRVADDLSGCWRGLERDTGHLHRILADRGLTALPVALDPVRPPRRVLRTPRYDAMQAHFDSRGDAGRVMMCSTAAVQVNLDAGVDACRRHPSLAAPRRALGPPLVAAFANSPARAGHLTGWRSARQGAVWQGMEPRRTHAPVGDDPVSSWADYALAAPLMMLRRDDGPPGWPRPASPSARGCAARWPGSRSADGGRPGPPPHDALPPGPAARLVRGPLPRRPGARRGGPSRSPSWPRRSSTLTSRRRPARGLRTGGRRLAGGGAAWGGVADRLLRAASEAVVRGRTAGAASGSAERRCRRGGRLRERYVVRGESRRRRLDSGLPPGEYDAAPRDDADEGT